MTKRREDPAIKDPSAGMVMIRRCTLWQHHERHDYDQPKARELCVRFGPGKDDWMIVDKSPFGASSLTGFANRIRQTIRYALSRSRGRGKGGR